MKQAKVLFWCFISFVEGLPTAKGRGMVEAGRGRSRWYALLLPKNCLLALDIGKLLYYFTSKMQDVKGLEAT